MTDHDDIRAALVRDHQRGGKFPADPELQHRAADWLAELLAEVNDAQAEAHNAQADYDRRGERLWRLAALAGWTPGNEADNDATAELYVRERLAEVDALTARAEAAEQAVRRVRTMANGWLRLSLQAIDPDVREWTGAAGRSVLEALDGGE